MKGIKETDTQNIKMAVYCSKVVLGRGEERGEAERIYNFVTIYFAVA